MTKAIMLSVAVELHYLLRTLLACHYETRLVLQHCLVFVLLLFLFRSCFVAVAYFAYCLQFLVLMQVVSN